MTDKKLIEDKLKALENISGCLNDLTPEQKERFDKAIARQQPHPPDGLETKRGFWEKFWDKFGSGSTKGGGYCD